MNTTEQKVAEYLALTEEDGKYPDMPDPEWLADQLNRRGYLAPDLPEPGTYASGEIEWATLDGYVNVENGLITVSHDERTEDDTPEQRERLHVDDGQIIITNPATAEYLGHLLIAAARVQTQRRS